jgi:hypothetical protein
MDSDLAVTILDIALTLLVPVAVWAGAKLSKWLEAKAINEKTGGMLVRLNDSIVTAVKAINQTTKAKIKASKDPNSPGGKKVTPEEAAELKKAALDEIRSYWGAKGLKEAGEILGLDSLDSWIDGKIEAAVHDTQPPAGTPDP